MLAKRIIPCLDIRNGRTVKGINFENITDVGDPVEMGQLYSEQGADELVYLDITATHEKRKTLPQLVRRIAKNLNIPFTVGGGVSELSDAEVLLENGADKLSINSAAVTQPEIITKLAGKYGSQFVVVAVDARFENGEWEVYVNGGRKPTGRELFSWVREAEERGAGEILFTSMNHDGTKNGYAVEALKRMAAEVSIPVIASGGAGQKIHFKEVFEKTEAEAALAASVFHYGEIPIPSLKKYLAGEGLPVRV
ncbi:MAG: imidazole glycerol phosphate synthase subunit HisF [Bacteroidales bacterium]|nr:imidazole glycerol phosphate synthase subunit HisF [Bacteroidales bacterium]MCF8333655.1 imidazole glycerol phosphate synthase subunit HisF [Bacteroidales bacterium]